MHLLRNAGAWSDTFLDSPGILGAVLLSTTLMYLTLALCGAGMGLLVAKYDLHRNEPWWLMVLTSILGAGMMHLAGIAQVHAVQWLPNALLTDDEGLSNTVLALSAATTEELGKFLVVCAVALIFRRAFDEPVDGLIYGSFAGLGAALLESVATLGFGQHSPYLPAQEPVRLAGHLIMGGVGCFGIGLITIRSRWAFVAIPVGLFTAMLLHWIWDIVAFDAADKYKELQLLHGWHTAVPVGLMIFGMIAFRWLVKVGMNLTNTQHARKQTSAASA